MSQRPRGNHAIDRSNTQSLLLCCLRLPYLGKISLTPGQGLKPSVVSRGSLPGTPSKGLSLEDASQKSSCFLYPHYGRDAPEQDFSHSSLIQKLVEMSFLGSSGLLLKVMGQKSVEGYQVQCKSKLLTK